MLLLYYYHKYYFWACVSLVCISGINPEQAGFSKTHIEDVSARLFTSWMPFLLPNQQYHSIDKNNSLQKSDAQILHFSLLTHLLI